MMAFARTLLGASLALAALSCGDGEADRDDETAPAEDGWFMDRAATAGLDFQRRTGGSGHKYLPEINGGCVAVLDHDGDGRLDLFFGQAAPLPGHASEEDFRDRLYRNLGGLRFEDVTAATGASEPGYTFHAAAPDLDGDGDPDLYLCNLADNAYLRNEGGRFVDASAELGTAIPAWSTCSTFGDLDLDGDLDAYITNYVHFSFEHPGCSFEHQGQRHRSFCSPKEFLGADDLLLRNEDGRLLDHTEAAGMAGRGGSGLAALACDHDDDGDLDLFVANDGRINFLWRNEGGLRFVDVAADAGVDVNAHGEREASMGCDWSDVDQDGDFDLLIANLALETNTLYRNEGQGRFRDVSNPSGLGRPSLRYVGFGCEFFDVDHDGDADAMVANGHVLDNCHLIEPSQTFRQPAQLYLGDGRGHFEERSADFGPYFEQRWVGRGLVTADLDDDGDLDVVVVHNEGPVALLENTRGNRRAWIGLKLRAAGANPDALGARVIVEAGGRRQMEAIRGSTSYSAFQDLRLHFGLGDASQADRVTIRWPDGREQRLEGLAARRYHSITQE